MRFGIWSALALLATACVPTESISPNFPVEPDGSIGDGISRPILEPIKRDQFKHPWRVFGASLACIFIAQGNTYPLLVVTSHHRDGIAGKAVIKTNNKPVVLSQNGGDSDTIDVGGSFSSEAFQISVELYGEETIYETQKQFFRPAILKISQDEGGSNMYEGRYECDASGVPT